MKQFKEQNVSEVYQRIQNQEDVQIVDVRELDEWESGHIPQALHIRLSEIPTRIKEFNQNREIIIVCRSGNRSGKACEYLVQLGYDVTNMQGGMLNWNYDIKYGE